MKICESLSISGSGLNLYLMSAEEVVQWYKPQTEEESHLVSVIEHLNIANDQLRQNGCNNCCN